MLTKAKNTLTSTYDPSDYPQATGNEYVPTMKERMDAESDGYIQQFKASGGLVEVSEYRGPRDYFGN